MRVLSVVKTLPVMAWLGACSTANLPVSDLDSNDTEVLDTSRTHGTVVNFTNWHDSLQIDAGLRRDGDLCRIIQPLVTDETTHWKPFQIYWGIRDDASDVTLGQEIRDVFFSGDSVKASEFPDVLGFKEVSGSVAGMLDIQSITLSADQGTVEARIGSPFSAAIRLKAVANGTSCASIASYCKTSTDCANAANFHPLTSVLVKQNFLGYPTAVIYN